MKPRSTTDPRVLAAQITTLPPTSTLDEWGPLALEAAQMLAEAPESSRVTWAYNEVVRTAQVAVRSLQESGGSNDTEIARRLRKNLETLERCQDAEKHSWGPTVAGRCAACGFSSLFLGAGGHVTCSNLSCSNPGAPAEALGSVERPPAAPEDAVDAPTYDTGSLPPTPERLVRPPGGEQVVLAVPDEAALIASLAATMAGGDATQLYDLSGHVRRAKSILRIARETAKDP